MILTDGGQILEVSSVFIPQGVQEDVSVGLLFVVFTAGIFSLLVSSVDNAQMSHRMKKGPGHKICPSQEHLPRSNPDVVTKR